MTDMLPPPPEEDFSDKSDREIMLYLLREVRSLRAEVSAMKKRLGEGDTEFTHVNQNIGILINSVQALCQQRGLEAQTEKLGDALEGWAARRNANGAHDVPTNPVNEKPEPPEGDG